MVRPLLVSSHSLLLFESPDPDAVDRICNHPDIWPQQRKMYEEYHNLVVSSNGTCVPIEYRRDTYGRFYVKNTRYMSATPMWAPARATLFNTVDLDIDGVQMHPNLLLHEMEKLQEKDENCPKFDALRAMCQNREQIFDACSIDEDWLQRFNDVNKSYMTKKDVFKLLSTIVIFGGGIQTWLTALTPARDAVDVMQKMTDKEYEELQATWRPENKYSLCPEMEAYIKQIPHLARYMMLQNDYDDILNWVTMKQKKKLSKAEPPGKLDSSKLPGQFLAILLQDIEATLLLDIMRHFSSCGLHPTVYAYDGFQIKQPASKHAMCKLQKALEHVNTFRPHAKFEIKPFRTPLDISNIPRRKIEFDITEFHKIMYDAEDEEEQAMVYEKQKAYFEMTHFYVMRQTAIAEVTTHGHYKGICTFPLDKAVANWENLYTLIPNPSKKSIEEGGPAFVKVPFFAGANRTSGWRKDEQRRTVQSIELFPQPGGRRCPPGCYNMWQGFEIEHTPYDASLDITPMLQHYNELIPDTDCREYLLNWIAHKIQKPGEKLRTCPILYGLQGVGKSAIFEKPFQHWLGNFHYKVSDSVTDITGRFAENSQYLVFVLNEATMQDNKQYIDALKNAVTADTHNQEKKAVQKEFNLNNVTDYVMTTNNAHCVHVEGDSDRRWFVVATSNKYANKEPATIAYFERLHAQLDSKPHQRALFEWFKRRDISTFCVRQFPSSNLRAAMILRSEKPEHTWLKQWLLKNKNCDKSVIHNKPKLYLDYKHFIVNNGYKFEAHKSNFYSMFEITDGIDARAKSNKERGLSIIDWHAAAQAVGLKEDAEPDE